MFYYQDSAEKHLQTLGYQKLTRRPWNVREDDIILLHHWATGPLKPEHWIPVQITITDKYPEYRRNTTNVTRDTKVSQTTYKFDHKALDPATDNKNLYGWWSTTWQSYDEVEVWRKPNSNTKK